MFPRDLHQAVVEVLGADVVVVGVERHHGGGGLVGLAHPRAHPLAGVHVLGLAVRHDLVQTDRARVTLLEVQKLPATCKTNVVYTDTDTQ